MQNVSNLTKETIEAMQAAGYDFERSKDGRLASNPNNTSKPNVKFFNNGTATVFMRGKIGAQDFNSHEEAAQAALKANI